MTETLTYYIAFTNGLKVLRTDGGSTTETGSFFDGKTLEHITGCREHPNVTFAAVVSYPDVPGTFTLARG